MEAIVYRGFNITLCGKTLKAKDQYIILTGRWHQIKKAIDKIIE